jgi:predicted nucleotide-binding protein
LPPEYAGLEGGAALGGCSTLGSPRFFDMGGGMLLGETPPNLLKIRNKQYRIAKFTGNQRRGERMNKIDDLIDRAKKLIPLDYTTIYFTAWKDDVIRFLKKQYGENSHEVNTINSIIFYDAEDEIFNGSQSAQNMYQHGLYMAIEYLKNYQRDFEEDTTDKMNFTKNKKEVFIIHGRNENIKMQVKDFLLQLKLSPIILNEQVNKGKTIIEKFENHSNVNAAIALFTDDDYGKFKEDANYENRARQNVIFEAGYFIGKLGRANTIILLEEGLNIPSDLSGYLYTVLDSNKGWHLELAKELKAIGLEVDLNNLI